MEVTIVLTNYLRPANMPTILASLASQTVPHQLFVWDNSPNQSFTCPRADWIIRSTRNAKCGARWWLAAHADTPWVVVMDDDLAPSDDKVLAETLDKLGEHRPSAVGATGVVLDPAKSYFDCQHVGHGARQIKTDTPVEILKGRYFAVATRLLEAIAFMPIESEDDVIASASVGGGVVPSCLQNRFRELATGREARVRRREHRQAREAARRRIEGGGGIKLDAEGSSKHNP